MSKTPKQESAGGEPVTNSLRTSSGGIGRGSRLIDLVVSEGPLRFAELLELSEIPKAILHRLLARIKLRAKQASHVTPCETSTFTDERGCRVY